jgi:hypothetical protein
MALRRSTESPYGRIEVTSKLVETGLHVTHSAFELTVPRHGEVTAALLKSVSGAVSGGSGAAADRAFSCSAPHSMEPGAYTVFTRRSTLLFVLLPGGGVRGQSAGVKNSKTIVP